MPLLLVWFLNWTTSVIQLHSVCKRTCFLLLFIFLVFFISSEITFQKSSHYPGVCFQSYLSHISYSSAHFCCWGPGCVQTLVEHVTEMQKFFGNLHLLGVLISEIFFLVFLGGIYCTWNLRWLALIVLSIASRITSASAVFAKIRSPVQPGMRICRRC